MLCFLPLSGIEMEQSSQGCWRFTKESSTIMGLGLLHIRACGSLEAWGQVAAKCVHVSDAASN